MCLNKNQDELMKRRVECDEMWLVGFTNELSAHRQANLTRKEREQHQLRKLAELVEFMSQKKIKEGEDVGRQSGSLQWRLSRGEIHTATTVSRLFKQTNKQK